MLNCLAPRPGLEPGTCGLAALNVEPRLIRSRTQHAGARCGVLRESMSTHRLARSVHPMGDVAQTAANALQKKGASPPFASEKSSLRERQRLIAGDDEVVQNAYLDQTQRLFQALGKELVRAARLCDPRWVIVREDHRCGIVCERDLYDLAWIDTRLRKRAPEELDVLDQPVLRIEK